MDRPSRFYLGAAPALLALAITACGTSGTGDAGPLDAGALDDAAPDLGPPDLGPPDLGPPDMPVRELGPPFVTLPYTGPAPVAVTHPATVTLAAACGVTAMQACSPLTNEGCDAGSGETCDLAADGTFQCFAVTSLAAPGVVGAACDGLHGPYCDVGLTCVGTGTGAATCARVCCAADDCLAGQRCDSLGARGTSRGNVGACVSGPAPAAPQIGNHQGIVRGRGFLPPWTSWRDALAREMAWYEVCPPVVGYPPFASMTHYDGACRSTGIEVIVAMQDGTGILSYLRYRDFTGDAAWLDTARALGDYIVDQGRSPNDGVYPLVPRSTGYARRAPQPPNCGIGDLAYELQPDKAGIAGHALYELGRATGDARYTDAALLVAQALVANMRTGDPTRSPWPFHADYRDGTPRLDVSSNMSFILRLFDDLVADGHPELTAARDALWSWIVTYQIPSAAGDGMLWQYFFEDHDEPSNRNAWAPLHLAKYLMERGAALDPDWQAHTETLLDFVARNFIDEYRNFPVCIEQDIDRKPFGGILSAYGAALAEYASRTGSAEHRARAYQALSLLVYAIDDDGCPSDRALETSRGGWQEDAHTDKVHNVVDALTAFPDWAD